LDLDGELGSSEDILLEENSSMTKKTIYLIPLILLSFWMIPEESFANVLVEQSISSATLETSHPSNHQQNLGTGLTGIPYTLETYWKSTVSGAFPTFYGRITNIDFIAYDDSGYTTPSPSDDIDFHGNYYIDNNIGKTLLTITTDDSTPNEFNPTKYYRIVYGIQSNGGFIEIYGSNSNDYANGSALCDGIACTNILDQYFIIRDNEQENTNTRIISLNNPTNNEEGLTSPVTFNFTYYYNSVIGGYATSGVKVIDILTNFQYTPTEDSINASGISIFNEQMNLTNSSCFSWQPYLRGASTTIFGATQLFETGTGCTGFQSTVGDTSTTSFFAFLNVTQQLRNKSPVGYIYIMSDILNNLDQISASSSVDLSMNLASSSAGYFTGTIDFFSADTIGEYLDDNMTNLLRNFMVVITYITTGMTLFALGRKTFT